MELESGTAGVKENNGQSFELLLHLFFYCQAEATSEMKALNKTKERAVLIHVS